MSEANDIQKPVVTIGGEEVALEGSNGTPARESSQSRGITVALESPASSQNDQRVMARVHEPNRTGIAATLIGLIALMVLLTIILRLRTRPIHKT